MTPETRQNHLSCINIINAFSDTSNTHDYIKITPGEREMNHIATGRALSLGGELLPPRHGSQQRRWRWRRSWWRWLRGQFPVPAACRNRDSVPRNLSSMAAALRNSSWSMAWFFRVYASGGINRRRGDVGGARGAQPIGWRGKGAHRAAMWFVWLLAPLRLSFGLRVRVGKIGTFTPVSCNSENISRTTFLKPKTTENRNWHCGILLIG